MTKQWTHKEIEELRRKNPDIRIPDKDVKREVSFNESLKKLTESKSHEKPSKS